MNETANATLALGALPVMAHAREEVEEMAALAGALVLNIGTLSPALGRGDAARRAAPRTRAASRSCSIPSARARRRIAPRRRSGSSTRSTSPCCAATPARSRRSSASRPRCAASSRSARAATRRSSRARPRVRSVSSRRSPARSTTSPTATASSRSRTAIRCSASITGTGCMSSALTGCFLAVNRERPLEAAAEALVAFGVAGEDAARDAKGPGSFHVALYDALAALDPATLDERARVVVRVHAIVDGLEQARVAVDAGATVVQLRVKAPTAEVVARGRGLRRAGRDLRRQRRRRCRARARRRRRASRPGRRRRRDARARAASCSAARSRALEAGARGRCRLPRGGAGLGHAVEGRRCTGDRPRGARVRSAPPRPCRSSRSAGSTRRTRQTASAAGAAGVAVIRAAADPALRRVVDEALAAR